MTPIEHDVLRLLRISTTISELAILLSVPRREIESCVEALRLAGEPIIGGAQGLRLTEEPGELAAYVEARRRRLVTVYRGTRALRTTLRRMTEAGDEREGLTLWA